MDDLFEILLSLVIDVVEVVLVLWFLFGLLANS